MPNVPRIFRNSGVSRMFWTMVPHRFADTLFTERTPIRRGVTAAALEDGFIQPIRAWQGNE